ncbi:sulfatase family protein [Nocardioides aurantiacus]|uniref:sulfatase family protein n=1 Tax=Nocardioides aurantiacus TaxID=86796 RepID=UPI0011CE9191|nr:sulfatase [Nocardioides aurantiacus]
MVALALVGGACTAPAYVGARDAGRDVAGVVAPSAPPASPSASTPARAASAPARRPNVMVIETDDMRVDDLRFMPRTRRLVGDRGLSFENSFAPNPLCCPSRASFLTGRYSHHHRVLTHEQPFGFAAFDDRRTLATALQGAGYRTALLGKYLNGYGQQRLRRPAAKAGQSSLRYVPPGWSHWAAGSDHLWAAGEQLRGGTYDYFSLVQNIDGRIVGSPGRYSTDVLGAQTRALTDRWRTGKPWFVWWNPVAPHHGTPREPDDPAPSLRDDDTLVNWLTPARPEWVKGRFDRRITHGSGVPRAGSPEAVVGDKPRYLRRLPELNRVEQRALTRLTRQRAESLYALDVQVGRTLQRLRRTGQLARTVVVFTSDNGFYLGEHRKRQGKVNAHEPSLRVPLLVAGPGVPRGKRFDPATTVDLGPTIASWAGTRLPGADGTDLRPTITGGDRGWTRPVVTEGVMPETAYTDVRRRWRGESAAVRASALNTRGLRLGRWKLTRYATGEAELYDLATDPLELTNLARDPAHAAVLRDLVALHRQYLDCAGAACRAPVPAPYAVGARRNRLVTQLQASAVRDYHR